MFAPAVHEPTNKWTIDKVRDRTFNYTYIKNIYNNYTYITGCLENIAQFEGLESLNINALISGGNYRVEYKKSGNIFQTSCISHNIRWCKLQLGSVTSLLTLMPVCQSIGPLVYR